MTPSGVKTGLQTALTAITGLRCYDNVPDGLAPPAAVIEPFEVDFHEAMSNGVTTYRAFILVIVGRMSERAAQDKLDTFLATTGSASIKARLETDRTLGGACSSLNVTTATPRTVTVSGIDMIAYRYEMEVYG